MRIYSCLKRPGATLEAKAAPSQVLDFRCVLKERGQAVRPRTKTPIRRCRTARRALKIIEVRISSCLERLGAILEAEAAPSEVLNDFR